MVREVPLSEDGIVFPRNEGTHGGVAAEDNLGMPAACTTLSRHEEILAINLVHMGAFNPNGVIFGASTLIDQYLALADSAVGGGVELLDANGAMSVIFGFSVGGIVIVYDVGAAIVIKEERGVDTTYSRQSNRVGPRAEGVLSGDEEIAPTDVGSHHIIGLIVWVILDGGGKDTSADVLVL